MVVLVVSDTHGDEAALRAVLKKEPRAHAVIHLGDGAREAARLQSEEARPWHIVCGNCDIGCSEPPRKLVTLGGARLYLTHGHAERVKSSLLTLCYTAMEQEAKAALFGHTHAPCVQFQNGILLCNPGSLAAARTYALLTADGGEVTAAIHTL